MSWKKKLLLDVVVSVLAGAVCVGMTKPLFGWSGWYGVWGLFQATAMWPFLHLFCWSEAVGSGWVWLVNPLVWLSLAAVSAWLLVRQFRRQDRLSLWLGAAAVAAWWFAGLFWLWFISTLE